ncbi:VOC family protein [Subtercola vilae]|uniref:VOC family protein n=1 Tax=Subtercola vilae TaxID=2056433 RepID=A0A4V4RFT5_9MICO|nr:VOC family protein [Subtercola vilae]TIH39024.1 VOC family protein [Subtercola vilae]
MQRIVPFLWFDDQAEEAAELYVSLFPDAHIDHVQRWPDGTPDAGRALVVEFTLFGQPWRAMNGGPGHPYTDAASFQVDCDTQEEVDRLWSAFTGDGGREIACGWCADRWGIVWQVTPVRLSELLADPDPGRASRTMIAMQGMIKLDIAALEAAADGR